MEAADCLYGVSMAGNGVSKVISRRLPPRAAAPTPARADRGYPPAADGPRLDRALPHRRRRARSRRPRSAARSAAGFFRRLRDNMRKTREALSAEVQATLFQGDLDEETWERLEEALIYADVGARTTAEVVERLEQEAEAGDGRRRRGSSRRGSPSCSPSSRGPATTRSTSAPTPTVILVVGVNGTGKTTTIGKLAWHLRQTLGRSGRASAPPTRSAPRRSSSSSAGASARACDVDQGARGLRPRLGRLRGGRPRPRARRRRGHHRHRRPPAHAARPDGRADQGPPRDRASRCPTPRTRR